MSSVIRMSFWCVFFVVSELLCCSVGQEFLQRGPTLSLAKEIQAHLDGVTDEKLNRWEEPLASMYNTFPKNADGLLEGGMVRYALHRMFVQRHGWYIKGIEPDGKAWDPSTLEKTLGAKVDKKLQLSIQQALVTGLGLRDLAALASLFEEIARQEASQYIQQIYDFAKIETGAALSAKEARLVTHAYMNIYLDPVETYPKSIQEGWQRARQDQEHWDGWREVAVWLHDVQRNVTGVQDASSLNFTMAARVAEEVGSRYAFFDVSECQGLKDILMTMESRERPGRVRLSEFYKKGMSTDELWQFNEKKEYLRDLGALDESDPQNPSVIIPNYIIGKPQCLPATSLYSVCCRSECEDLLTGIEDQVGEATAQPEQLLPIIEALPSNTVSAPRKLTVRLAERLQQVADVNGGEVPLHGRLFAQWMHHAYPRECPFPHELGTTTPMGPAAWMATNGHESTQASEEEMVCHVSGPCAGGNDTDDPTAADPLLVLQHDNLPWSETEELLHSHPPSNRRRYLRSLCQAAVVIAMIMVVFSAVAVGRRGLNSNRGEKQKRMLTSQELFAGF